MIKKESQILGHLENGLSKSFEMNLHLIYLAHQFNTDHKHDLGVLGCGQTQMGAHFEALKISSFSWQSQTRLAFFHHPTPPVLNDVIGASSSIPPFHLCIFVEASDEVRDSI